ncbi:MAG: lysophospholipid acyltransferase family protein [Candidatus Binatia bacterium]
MFYPLEFTVIVFATVLLATLTTLCGIFEAHGKRAYRINQFWTWVILRVAGISLKVAGLENIDPKRQYIFIVNHQSNLDIPVLIEALPEFQLRWIAKKELLRVPFFGWALWATKHVTVDRADPRDAVKSLERAKQMIAAGISLVVFAEGTRSRDRSLQKFKKGGFLLAVQTHTPIVPVTVNGSGSLLPAGAWRLRPGTIEVVVDQPVAVEGFRPGNLRLLSNQVRDKIASHLLEPCQTQPRHSERLGETIVNHRAFEKRSA